MKQVKMRRRFNIQIRRRKWAWIGHTEVGGVEAVLRDDEASKTDYTWRQLKKIAQDRPR